MDPDFPTFSLERQVLFQEFEKLPDAVLAKCAGLFTSKELALAAGGSPVLVLLKATADKKAPEEGREKKEKKEKKDKKEKKEKKAEKDAEKEQLPDGPGAVKESPENSWAIGDVVVTKANKWKDKYDNCEGRVVGILSNQLKIELTSGPAATEIRKYNKDMVTLKSPKPEVPPAEAAAQVPAGQGASESEASRKRKAAELFQDVELP